MLPLLPLLLPALPLPQDTGGVWEGLYDCEGHEADDWFAISLSSMGDVDGDGVPEVLLGSPCAPGVSRPGSADLLSGRVNTHLYRISGEAPGDRFGWSVSRAGDLTGDGIEDFLVGAPGADPGGRSDAGAAYLISGRTGSQVLRLDGAVPGEGYGTCVASAGDCDGDGVDDILVGAPDAAPGGRTAAGSAWLHSGAGGPLLARWDGGSSGDRLGTCVAGAGDVDGDGRADVLLGAPGFAGGAGGAFLHSGDSHALIGSYQGGGSGAALGSAVAGAGDLDGDGFPELLLGAPGAGEVEIRSWRRGVPLAVLRGTARGSGFGSAVASAGDVDGDGLPDPVVGAPWSDPAGRADAGATFVFSGASGRVLARWEGLEAGDLLGWSVSGVGDLDQDGADDVLAGAPLGNPEGVPDMGSAFIRVFRPCLHANRQELSIGAGDRLVLDLAFPARETGRAYQVLVSASGDGPAWRDGVAVPLTLDAVTAAALVGPGTGLLAGARGTLDATGAAQAILDTSRMPALAAGQTLWFAAITAGTGGRLRVSSVSRLVRIQP